MLLVEILKTDRSSLSAESVLPVIILSLDEINNKGVESRRYFSILLEPLETVEIILKMLCFFPPINFGKMDLILHCKVVIEVQVFEDILLMFLFLDIIDELANQFRVISLIFVSSVSFLHPLASLFKQSYQCIKVILVKTFLDLICFLLIFAVSFNKFTE